MSKPTDAKNLVNEKIPVSTSNIYVGKKSLIILLQFCFGIIVVTLVNFYPTIQIVQEKAWYILLFMPFGMYGNLWLFTFSVAGLTWIILKIQKKIHPIKPGIFSLDSDEFKHYKQRYWVSYFALWLARALPLPWVDYIVYSMLGNKVGSYVCLYDSWIDMELIEFGKNVMTSMNSVIMSHAIYQDKFIQLRTVLKDNSIVGAEAIVAPGTVLDEEAILGAGCSSYIGQQLASGVIHLGNPATKMMDQKPIKKLKENQEEKES